MCKRWCSVLLISALILSLAVLPSCTMPQSSISRSGFYFDTYISVTVFGDEETLDGVFELCAKYDRLLDRYDENSDIYKINNSHGTEVEVAPEVLEIINLAIYYSQMSEGVFDLTCGSATILWDFNSENAKIPDEQARNDAVKLIDYTSVKVNENKVFVPDGVQLDLGGIAKGFVADKIVEFLVENGVEDALIDLGGNILALGDKNGSPWRIGIKYPDSSDYVGAVKSSERMSVVTSGDYERYFEIDSVRYHHILDTDTAMPAVTDVRSVTILSQSSAQGDALSTICFILGYEAASELVSGIDGVEAVFVLDDGRVIQTADIL